MNNNFSSFIPPQNFFVQIYDKQQQFSWECYSLAQAARLLGYSEPQLTTQIDKVISSYPLAVEDMLIDQQHQVINQIVTSLINSHDSFAESGLADKLTQLIATVLEVDLTSSQLFKSVYQAAASNLMQPQLDNDEQQWEDYASPKSNRMHEPSGKLEQKLIRLQQKLERKGYIIGCLQQKVQSYHKYWAYLVGHNQKLLRLNEAQAGSEEQLELARSARAELGVHVATLEQQLQLSIADQQALNSEISALERTSLSTKKLIHALQRSATFYHKTNASLRLNCQRLTTQVGQRLAEIEQLTKEHTELTKQLDEVQQQLRLAVAKLNHHRLVNDQPSRASLSQERTQKQHELVTFQQANQQLREQIIELETRLAGVDIDQLKLIQKQEIDAMLNVHAKLIEEKNKLTRYKDQFGSYISNIKFQIASQREIIKEHKKN